MTCEAAIFDCDGLLLDTAEAWTHAFHAAAAELGFALTGAHLAALTGSSVDTGARRIAGWAGTPDRTGRARSALRSVLAASLRATPPPVLPGVAELVHRLHDRLPLAVASNAPAEILADVLTGAGLLTAFSAVISAEEAGRPKPAPDVYLSACRRLRADPRQSVALEDSFAGATAAHDAGLSLVVATRDDWPTRTPLPWPGAGRPVLYVTSLDHPAVLGRILGPAAENQRHIA
ncbi:HAD superfamily hydrolase (TIGR01509 family) [Amycolatopsis bartoniae]|uniref:Haloacid dehalogenase n=1 Tax=Amycolatopsis bartoniae TaxID=941986 RepID=A0A8H9M2U6_9PSEU|nr:HAD family phosphatase [Amycolatopsis bartoniae]MBB2938236.1 HAD superfamily hydrolase (TIGR01509 family) [Amycolatopsis bartoniae]TVT09016.1 HAD family phosphatase [Amycolatopsis bartoniae]GHF33684.1 haloacid dehalogenase [Amycolatopsis bartoniae]